jgi:hypothetical protein
MTIQKRLYVALVLLIGIAIVGSYLALRRDEQRRKNLESEATADIIGTEVRRLADPESGKEQSVDTLVTYSYSIDGKDFTKTVRIGKVAAARFIPWGKAKVCYDPKDIKTIEDAELFPTSHQCGN